MLRRDEVCDLQGHVHASVGQDDHSVVFERSARDLPPRQDGQLFFQLLRHLIGKVRGTRHKHRRRVRVMFRLGKHVRREDAGIVVLIGDNQHLARARHGVR